MRENEGKSDQLYMSASRYVVSLGGCLSPTTMLHVDLAGRVYGVCVCV